MKRIVICISILFSIPVFGVMHANDIIDGFEDGKDIEINIVKGSQYYLTAAGYALQMLAEIEKSSMETLNSDNTLEAVNKAKGELDLSLYYYRKALDAAINAKYSDKIANFYNFNYDKFIAENGLNENIAKKVQEYLVKGDIVGIYKQNIRNIEEIRASTILIQNQLNARTNPDITTAWHLYQKIAEASLFGNYSTVMAKNILK